jgi:hypothetical protein
MSSLTIMKTLSLAVIVFISLQHKGHATTVKSIGDVPWMGSMTAIGISLTGHIDPHGLDKITHVVRSEWEKKHPDIDWGASDHSSSKVILFLDSPGGDYAEGMRIAEFVKAEGIGTRIKERAFCKSACAFIFMAGQHTAIEGDTGPDRAVEIGGRLEFHSPFPDEGLGIFEDGALSIAKLIEVLGDLLPRDLFLSLTKQHGNNFTALKTTGQALEWKITLANYKEDRLGAVDLLNLCLNYFGSVKADFDLGRLTVEASEAEKHDWIRKNPNMKGVITYSEQVQSGMLLPTEANPDLAGARKDYKAPRLYKYVDLGDGHAADQFLFDYGDQQGVIWCTVWDDQYGTWIVENKTTIAAEGMPLFWKVPPVDVPYWAKYPPNTDIGSLRSSRP